MDIVSKNSEKLLAEFITSIQREPDQWMCIHVNTSPLNAVILNSDGVTKSILEKMHLASNQIAQKLYDLGLSSLEGRIFICEDSDVVAFYSNRAPSETVLEKLKKEFASESLKNIFFSFPMKEKFGALIDLSQAKIQSAEKFGTQKKALDLAEHLFENAAADLELMHLVQTARKQHPMGVVLVIEDDIISRNLIAAALHKKYVVIQAKSAKSGMAAYLLHAPNVVLLDIHLPDRNGLEILTDIKKLDPDAYVVMLSSDSAVKNVVFTRGEGAGGFIKKPFTKDKLLEQLIKCPNLGPEAAAKALGWCKMAGPERK